MKKIIILLILVCSLLLLCSCNDNTGRVVIDNQNISQEDNNQEQSTKTDEDQTIKYKKIDVDLASMNGTIAYSQVYDMLTNPSKYEGKIVKMTGPFTVYYSSETKLYYPAVIIRDATACCAQGIEFVLYGKSSYPSGYPEVNSEVTVVGKFETYYEGNSRYCHLINSVLV